jgi:hypothetical protein
MSRTLRNRVTYGDAILSRFTGVGVPGSLKNDHAAFKAQHALFVKASTAVTKAELAYDTTAKKVAKLDGGRDETVLAIADKIPAAKLGRRESPFADFSKYAPTKLVNLSYAAETIELRSLFAALLDKKPPRDIADLCHKGIKQNEAVDEALKELDAPLAALNEARAKRDAAIPDWEKHLRHLQDATKVAFRDESGRFDAIFSEPDAAQTHVRPVKRKAMAADAGSAAGDQAAPAPAAKAKPAKRKKRRAVR